MVLGGISKVIRFTFEGDTKDIRNELGKAEKGLDGVSGASKKTGGALSSLKGPAIAAGAVAGTMAAKWAIAGIDMAETAELVDDSFQKVFGAGATDFLERNEELRESLGLSETDFKKLTNEIGATQVALGKSSDDAAMFAEQLIIMAGDAAAFAGDIGSSDEVLGAFQSALRGSFEPLERFGVVIKQSDVNTRALTDSGKESVDQLTEIEKQTATVALIQDQMSLATGALSENLDTNAVKQNTLNARMKEAQEKFGAALLPIKTLLLEALLPLVPVLEALAPILGVVGTLLGALTPIVEILGLLLKPFTFLLTAIGEGFAIMLRPIEKASKALSKFIGNLKGIRIPKAFKTVAKALGFQTGGVVPGSATDASLAVLHGGERVVANNQAGQGMGGGGGGGGMTVINLSVEAGISSPTDVARAIVDALEEYNRQNGPLNIKIAG